jgi:hypothetical protein
VEQDVDHRISKGELNAGDKEAKIKKYMTKIFKTSSKKYSR